MINYNIYSFLVASVIQSSSHFDSPDRLADYLRMYTAFSFRFDYSDNRGWKADGVVNVTPLEWHIRTQSGPPHEIEEYYYDKRSWQRTTFQVGGRTPKQVDINYRPPWVFSRIEPLSLFGHTLALGEPTIEACRKRTPSLIASPAFEDLVGFQFARDQFTYTAWMARPPATRFMGWDLAVANGVVPTRMRVVRFVQVDGTQIPASATLTSPGGYSGTLDITQFRFSATVNGAEFRKRLAEPLLTIADHATGTKRAGHAATELDAENTSARLLAAAVTAKAEFDDRVSRGEISRAFAGRRQSRTLALSLILSAACMLGVAIWMRIRRNQAS